MGFIISVFATLACLYFMMSFYGDGDVVAGRVFMALSLLGLMIARWFLPEDLED